MKQKVLDWLFLGNYIVFIFYVCWNFNRKSPTVYSVVPLLISSLLLSDITYINSGNIRESKIIDMFCGLLLLDSWYMLLSAQKGVVENIVFTGVSPMILYCSLIFVLLFLFQGSGYRYHKAVNILLFLTCGASMMGLCVSYKVFYIMYGIQFLVGIVCFLFVVLFNWKRVAFVLKSEWKWFTLSIVTITVLFLVYYLSTKGIPNHISNFGVYLPTMLFFMSVHGIVQKENKGLPLSTVFNLGQMGFIFSFTVVSLVLMIWLLDGGVVEFLVCINAIFAFVYLCNIILGQSLKQGKREAIKQNEYDAGLKMINKEEQLKTEFSNFLHDDVLSDLLSIKNMMSKAHRPDIQDIIMETLDNMNIHIRGKMQDYHPVMMRNLTPKENYQNLIESVGQSFKGHKLEIMFDCPQNFFIVQPYDILLYRIQKELLINAYKHSKGSKVWITLNQENDIIKLCVRDDGIWDTHFPTDADRAKQKGLASIYEQVESINGKVSITNNNPRGMCVQIIFQMKGDDSYQYFVGG